MSENTIPANVYTTRLEEKKIALIVKGFLVNSSDTDKKGIKSKNE